MFTGKMTDSLENCYGLTVLHVINRMYLEKKKKKKKERQALKNDFYFVEKSVYSNFVPHEDHNLRMFFTEHRKKSFSLHVYIT